MCTRNRVQIDDEEVTGALRLRPIPCHFDRPPAHVISDFQRADTALVHNYVYVIQKYK